MSSIYEITSCYLRLQEMMEDPELDPQALADTMEAIDGEIEDKAESYGMVIKNLEAEMAELDTTINQLKAEIERLTGKKNTIKNNITRMKDRLKMAMVATGKLKFKTKLFSFSVSDVNPSVVLDCDNPEKYPNEFIRMKKEINKKALMDAMKAAELDSILGLAHLDRGTRLNMR